MIFATMPAFGGDGKEVMMLAHSIRRWAGCFARADIVVMDPEQAPLRPDARQTLVDLGATVIPFKVPEAALKFPFAQKVFAAAEAEKKAEAELLIWMDADTLVLEEPAAFDLPAGKTIGCCPVQLKNISALANEAPNAFWQAVYAGCGTPAGQIFNITTTVDHTQLQAHFNAGLLVVRPEAGLLQAWAENFARLYAAPAFHPFYTENKLYQIFVHQAVLAATLMARLPEEAFCLFPERYNVAVFLRSHFAGMPTDPITLRYDEMVFFEDPKWTTGGKNADEKAREMLKVV